MVRLYSRSGPFHVGVEEEAGFAPLVGTIEGPGFPAVEGLEADAFVSAENEGDGAFAGVGDEDGVGGAGAGGGPAGDVAHAVYAHEVGGRYGVDGLEGAEGLEDTLEGPAVVVFLYVNVDVSGLGLIHDSKLPSGWWQVQGWGETAHSHNAVGPCFRGGGDEGTKGKCPPPQPSPRTGEGEDGSR